MTAPHLLPTAPQAARKRVDRLVAAREQRVRESRRLAKQFEELNRYLELAPKVSEALEKISEQLFQQLLRVVEEKLTIALSEVLEQPIRLRAETGFKHKAASVEFWIERDGNKEDIMQGQGGSVANILSVGLRMFALATLDDQIHRRFLVLDEQDCWLRPDLVPRLVKIVRDAGQALGFQVIMISHHDISIFEQYADKLIQLVPTADVVEVRERAVDPIECDSN